MTANVAASIRARLLNKARNIGSEFELFLVRYACERFLYRLGESVERERCILKGATLLALWMEEPYRATRDIRPPGPWRERYRDCSRVGCNDLQRTMS